MHLNSQKDDHEGQQNKWGDLTMMALNTLLLASPDPAGDVLDGPRVPRDDPGWPLQSHPGHVGVWPVSAIITIFRNFCPDIVWPSPHVDHGPVPERTELRVILQHNKELLVPDDKRSMMTMTIILGYLTSRSRRVARARLCLCPCVQALCGSGNQYSNHFYSLEAVDEDLFFTVWELEAPGKTLDLFTL